MASRFIRPMNSAGHVAGEYAKRVRDLAFLCFLTVLSLEAAARADSALPPLNRALSVQERSSLECPPPTLAGPFAAPTEVQPSQETPFDVFYSPGNDLVRLSGTETEANVVLGAGDDLALFYDIGDGLAIEGDSGADTIMLCSMSGPPLHVTLGTEDLSADSDRDIIVVDSSVITSVPTGLRRVILIFDFDPGTDRLVVHAPARLVASREASPVIGGIRVGNVTFKIYRPGGNGPVDYNGDTFAVVARGRDAR